MVPTYQLKLNLKTLIFIKIQIDIFPLYRFDTPLYYLLKLKAKIKSNEIKILKRKLNNLYDLCYYEQQCCMWHFF